MNASIRLGIALGLAWTTLFVSSSRGRAAYVSSDIRFPSPQYMGTNPVEFPTPGGVYRAGRGNDFFDIFIEPPSFGRAPLPPVPGPPQINSFFDVFADFDLTTPLSPPTSVHGLVQMTTSVVRLNGLPPGEPVFNTEMLQLDISGGTLPLGIHLRESPTKASLGRTSLMDLGGGLYQIDSFFDVFTEISLDNGATWTPAANALRLVGVAPEPAAATLLLMGCAAVGRRCRKGRN